MSEDENPKEQPSKNNTWRYLIGGAAILWIGYGLMVREQGIEIGVNYCRANTPSVNCACLERVLRKETPTLTFWLSGKSSARQSRINAGAKQCTG